MPRHNPRRAIPRRDRRLIAKEVESYASSHGMELPPGSISIEYSSETPTAEISRAGEEKYLLSIGPGQPKRDIQSSVRHEMKHIEASPHRFGSATSAEDPDIAAYSEIQAVMVERNFYPARLGDIAIGLVDYNGLSKGEAWEVVSRNARELGLPGGFIRQGKLRYWEYWRKNA